MLNFGRMEPNPVDFQRTTHFQKTGRSPRFSGVLGGKLSSHIAQKDGVQRSVGTCPTATKLGASLFTAGKGPSQVMLKVRIYLLTACFPEQPPENR